MKNRSGMTLLMCLALCLQACADTTPTETDTIAERATASNGQANTPISLPSGRVWQPVVLLGAEIPAPGAMAPEDLVAFRWAGGAWSPVPIQVDERVRRSWTQVHPGVCDSCELEELFYADPATRVGPDCPVGQDCQTVIDDDDEIVFMARDLGRRFDAEVLPEGVSAAHVEVRVDDPTYGRTGYLYLFRNLGGAAVPETTSGVSYEWAMFHHPDGTYLQDYLIGAGAGGMQTDGSQCGLFPEDQAGCLEGSNNRESTTIQTPFYRTGFSNRWIQPELRRCDGGECGQNLTDLPNGGTAPHGCNRSVATAAFGHGGFSVNISGPVRALRGEYGANSAKVLHRVTKYYDRAWEAVVDIRLHSNYTVPKCDTSDLSNAIRQLRYVDYDTDLCLGSGQCRYLSRRLPCGAEAGAEGTLLHDVVDGEQALPTAGDPPAWEFVHTPEGSVLTIARFTGGLDSDPTPLCVPWGYYDINATEEGLVTCVGDDNLVAASGPRMATCHGISDPRYEHHRPIHSSTWTFLDSAPGQPVLQGDRRADEVDTPLLTQAALHHGGTTVTCDGICDGGPDCTFDCLTVAPGSCGDGLCLPTENSTVCPADCDSDDDPNYFICGDGVCEEGEVAMSCPSECG